MFKPVNSKLEISALEQSVLNFWKAEDVFHQSIKQREGRAEYVFFEGPPTANGKPGTHHVLSRAFKDIFPRFRTMRGFHVLRRGGWDTHGLPVEIEVEKKLGFNNKQQIENFGIAKFNALCRESAFAYIKDWEKLTDRIGYWVDLETAYVTYTNSYVESVWWILKEFWKKDLIYQGFKVVPYCPRCGTPLSDHEVALGYRDVEDPSIYVRMPLVDEPDTSLLIWTTTPWTLPGNVAVAAGEDVDYVTIERMLNNGNGDSTEKLILAESRLTAVFGEQPVKIVDRFKGNRLRGKRYHPLFTFVPVDKPAYFVVLGDFVSTEDGTGLVHLAPAYGEDDMRVAQKEDLPILQTVAPNGTFISDVRSWAGKFVKDADPLIIDQLQTRGLLFKSELYPHSYPFCWRCDTPLLYYARKTWYIRTSQFKQQLVELNKKINWHPEHIRDGRFGNWLENNQDWALGRERYWGTPLPVWICGKCQHKLMVASREELGVLAKKDLSNLDMHRPYVDEIKLDCPQCNGTMTRIPELIDVWFDSGSMPVAQWHYPFENQEMFKNQFPADYICEAVDQTRGWFYSLHAISTLLFNNICFKDVICLGLILDGEGQKMSKTRGNVVDPWEVINQHGSDAMRWYFYTASPPGQERRFSSDLVGEVVRNFMLTLWNTYSFFVTYANLDHWKPDSAAQVHYSPLDQWLRAELHALIRDVTQAYETYDVLAATRPIEVFVDHLSNWYLRRSRRRFWKSESDEDKKSAYATLYEALVAISKLIAPAMPFIADEFYRNLVVTVDPLSQNSVHLTDWPDFDPALINEDQIREMSVVMKMVTLGHASRNKANIKVRQPLSEAAFALSNKDDSRLIEKYADLLKDELNVKNVRNLSAAGEAVAYEVVPLPKQLGQKYKNEFPLIKKAILELPADKTALSILSGKNLKIKVGRQIFEIQPDEVEVRLQAKPGYTVAAEGPMLAALVTELDEKLIMEGMAREFVRHVQEARKQAGLDIADRISLAYTATEKLQAAIREYSDYIKAETLTVELNDRALPNELPNASDEFDGQQVTLWIKRAEKTNK
jgi:isoleucyl-tRNA synthetase